MFTESLPSNGYTGHNIIPIIRAVKIRWKGDVPLAREMINTCKIKVRESERNVYLFIYHLFNDGVSHSGYIATAEGKESLGRSAHTRILDDCVKIQLKETEAWNVSVLYGFPEVSSNVI
jgi:hypothetical protein